MMRPAFLVLLGMLGSVFILGGMCSIRGTAGSLSSLFEAGDFPYEDSGGRRAVGQEVWNAPCSREVLEPPRFDDGPLADSTSPDGGTNSSGLTFDKFTIIMNTFRRNDLLMRSLAHHAACAPEVPLHSIRIVWSDLENAPPDISELRKSSAIPIIVDIHTTDSLNNRFKLHGDLATHAVFSTDDDLLHTCSALTFAFNVWRHFPNSLVGFNARGFVKHDDGHAQYVMSPQPTFTIILTKNCFLHQIYLARYWQADKVLLDYVDLNMNCEVRASIRRPFACSPP